MRRCGAIAAVLGIASFAATPALARPSAQRAAHIRASLAKDVRRHPGVVTKRWFLRQAGLVKFKLPVTLRLRDSPLPTATVDLGPSLGSRTIALGGSLAGDVLFSDDFDGGAMGSVGINIVPSDTAVLRSSSIPLLWNDDVSDPGTRSDANVLAATTADTGLSATGLRQGCGDFTQAGAAGTSATPPGYNALYAGYTPAGSGFGPGQGLPGYPYEDPDAGPVPAGYLPIYPGVDAIDALHSGGAVADNDSLGPSQDPFPGASSSPLDGSPGVSDTVLRTNALRLQVASPGPAADGPQPGIVMGASGGQANLFGNIPGRNVAVDVTVNLKTRINSILRVVDQDVEPGRLQTGQGWPAAMLQCRQLWTGAVQNYLPGIRLEGQLRIAPALTPDGRLRIARVTVSSPADAPARVALGACLQPAMSYAAAGAGASIPPAAGGNLIPEDSTLLPLRADTERYAPGDAPADVPCDAPGDPLLRSLGTQPVGDGSSVVVAGDVRVAPIDVDVIIGAP